MKTTYDMLKPTLYFLAFATLILVGCNANKNDVQISQPEDLGSIVSSHMPSQVKARDAVRVRFAQLMSESEEFPISLESNSWSIKPQVDGHGVWEDPYTFRFHPETQFEPEQQYLLTFNREIVGTQEDLQFQFHVRPVTLRISFEELSPSSDPLRLELKGQVESSIPVEDENIQKLLTTQYAVSKPSISWTHERSGRQHNFLISGIQRGQKTQTLKINWNGKPVKSDARGERMIAIPASGEFKITDVDVENGGTRKIVIHFSDQLDQAQNVQGLVRVSSFDGDLNIEKRGHQLILYPSDKLTGAFQLLIDQSIKNNAGKTLGENQRMSLSFEDIKPQLKLVGKGVIVPNDESVDFPFEAINVKSVVVEIFEVFENNVLQFLQYQELNNSWGLDPVGRIVAQEKVDLEITEDVRNAWQRYTIDMSHYTNLSPGSIYQVRIGFNRDQVLYGCQNDFEDSKVVASTSDEELRSIMQYDYDYPGYNYNQIDDPCYPAYYNADRFISRNILASNLGITAKSGTADEMTVQIVDLRNANTLSGVNVGIYDFQKQLISSSTTNASGVCELTKSRKPFFIIADWNGEKGYLKLSDATARSMSDFDVDGVKPQKGMKGYLYAERDVWRPGDSIFLNFVLEDESLTEVDHPVSCTLINPRGQKLYTKTISRPVGPVYPFYMSTSKKDMTGNWRVEVVVGGNRFSKILKIETIQPNRLKIEIESDDPILAFEEKPKILLKSRWLHGAPASGLKAEMELQLQKSGGGFNRYQDYRFDDPSRFVDARVATIFSGQLNDQGAGDVELSQLELDQLPGPMRAAFRTRVFEKGGNFSSDRFSVPFHPFESYVGVNLPEARWGGKRLEIHESNDVEMVVVDATGIPISNRDLTVGLYQCEWRWWWDRSDRSIGQYSSAVHTGAYLKDTIRTGSNGKASISITPEEYGMYMIRICDTESGHCSGDFYYAGYVWNNESDKNTPVKLVFQSDQEEYQVGQQVSLTIPSIPGSVAEISLESHDGLMHTERITSNGDQVNFSFQATPEMLPNIYAHVSIIQPQQLADNDLPLRMFGVLPIRVVDERTQLNPVIQMPDQLEPEKSFAVNVSEKNGKEMSYTLAVVDEGLLDITRFETPNPHQYFYAKEALTLKTWDIYDYVLNAHGQAERILSIGGDGNAPEAQAIEEVNRFKPVVMHLGPFTLKAGQKATHELTMPNYVGSVRTMVVASGIGKYGSVEKTTAVKQPLMLLATMPRVLSPGEQVRVPVNVFAMEDGVKNVTVRLKTNENLEVVGASEKSVAFNKPGDQLVYFLVDVKARIGAGLITVEAISGRHQASQNIEIEVINPNPIVSEVAGDVIDPGQVWTKNEAIVGMRGADEATLEVYGVLPFGMERRLGYLIRYPYGCLEQTTSAAFPQLFVSNLIELSPERKQRVTRNVQAALKKVRRFMNRSGGYSYWPGDGYVNTWTNSYVGHFLVEAKNAGYFVDEDLLDHWYTYQRRAAVQFDSKSESESAAYRNHLVQSYRLYTLAKYGQPEFGAMNRLRNDKKLSSTSRALLAAAYALSGQDQTANDLIVDLSTDVPEYTETGYTYGTELRDRALIIEAFVAMGKREEAAPIIRRIAEVMDRNVWISTQSTAFALIAISGFVEGKSGDGMNFSFVQNGGERQIVKSESPVFSIQLEANNDGQYDFSVENLGSEVLYTRLIKRGRPIEPNTKKVESHLNMSIQYFDVDGKIIDPSSIQQGTDFVAEVRVSNPGTLRYRIDEIALQQIFPSGWEILNQRLDLFQDALKNDPYDYQDIRDDRIYTFFDLNGKTSHVYRVALNAAYEGRFMMPGVSCEAMYDHSIRSYSAGKWVEVTKNTSEFTNFAGFGTGE